MTPLDRARAYLSISAEYAGNLGLVWSASGDAIERWNGTTFIFVDEIHEVLAGPFARPPVPPFDFVLALLHVLRDGPETSSIELDRLWRAHTAAKGSTNLLRHAGLLISELCSALPACANAPEFDAVAAALGGQSPVPDWHIEKPPLLRIEFQRRIEARLAEFDDARLLHWLKNGCDPLRVAEQLAEPLDTLPVRVAKLLTEFRRQPRLAGAVMLVPALDGALTFPARRRSPDAVPQGGYCDVTTRGEPERLLPSQFVLDPDEFVRRFAAHELLYFQREEPHAARKPERLIVLDQGVRTWGGVRLALAAATLVLMKKDAKRIGRVTFATTSAPKPIDVLEADLESLMGSLESSDLSTNPGACLVTALASSGEARDVILLSHTRALRENAVQNALDARAAEDRVFALTVDERGAAELIHWKETGPESVRRFRVDLAAAEAVWFEEDSPPPIASTRFEAISWKGDVEPVPFPFRPGLVAVPEMMAFDSDGEWLVAVSHGGILQAIATDGTPAEVLPRPFKDGRVLRSVEAVLGVPGGVAVCGRLRALPSANTTAMHRGEPVLDASASEAEPPDRFIVAHYDRRKHTAAVFDLGPAVAPARWSAFPELNCVALTLPDGRCSSVDLASRGVCIGPTGVIRGVPSRAETARQWAKVSFGSPPFSLAIRSAGAAVLAPDSPHLMVVGNGLVVNSVAGGGSERLMPMRDGKFLLEGAEIHQAQAARDTLAMALKRSGERMFILIARSENRILGELNLASSMERFTLSPDGGAIAHMRPFRTLAISATNDVGSPRVEVKPAALHSGLAVSLEGSLPGVTIRIGTFEHVFSLQDGVLTHVCREGPEPTSLASPGTVLHPPTAYDLTRFPPREIAHRHGLRAVLDRLGQVLLYRHDGQLVATFLVRRERAAAWVPNGVFWGDPLLIGGPASPLAAERVGMALLPEEYK